MKKICFAGSPAASDVLLFGFSGKCKRVSGKWV